MVVASPLHVVHSQLGLMAVGAVVYCSVRGRGQTRGRRKLDDYTSEAVVA